MPRKSKVVMSVEGSSGLTLKLPINDEFRMMTMAESYLASCYAIWVAAAEDVDPRAVALRHEIMSLTLEMMNEGETIH